MSKRRFPVWETIKIKVNGREFEIDLVKVKLSEIDHQLKVFTWDDIVRLVGLFIVFDNGEYYTKILAYLHKNNKFFKFLVLKPHKEIHLVQVSRYDTHTCIYNNPELKPEIEDYYIVFIQPRELEATAGVPVAA